MCPCVYKCECVWMCLGPRLWVTGRSTQYLPEEYCKWQAALTLNPPFTQQEGAEHCEEEGSRSSSRLERQTLWRPMLFVHFYPLPSIFIHFHPSYLITGTNNDWHWQSLGLALSRFISMFTDSHARSRFGTKNPCDQQHPQIWQ